MELTKTRAIELHRELWDWLYHHPSKGKDDWPRWVRNRGDIFRVKHDCFLCESINTDFFSSLCDDCPLEWPTIRLSDDEFQGRCITESYFGLWQKAKSPKTRKKYAKLIRDLPERKS